MTALRSWTLALATLLAAPAFAGTWNMRCTEFEVQGADRTADCSREIFLRSAESGVPAELMLRTGYSTKAPQEEHVSFTLQVLRIDMPTEADATLAVAGLRVERMRMPSQQRSFAQGPARGSCQVSGLNTPEPVFRCTVQAGDAAIGRLRFTMSLDSASTRRQYAQFARHPLKDLREARFTLAAAEQAGRLARMDPAAQAYGEAEAAQAAAPLTEKTCVTEAQARQAEALAASGGAAAQRLAGICFRYAAGREPEQAERLSAKSIEWFDKAIAAGDARALTEKGLTIRFTAERGRWDPAHNTFQKLPPTDAARLQDQAAKLFAQAAERGDAEGQFQFCQVLQMPDLGACAGLLPNSPEQLRCVAGARPRDAAGAARQCQAAADQGHAHATARLADFYAAGLGVAKDVARSRQLVWQAAERGDIGTLHNLARAYETGMPDTPAGPIERDIGKAIEFYKRTGNDRKIAELQAAQGSLGTTTDATVYGIAVGFALPGIHGCEGVGASPDARLCLDADVGKFVRWLDQLGFGQQSFAENGLRLLAVKVNDQKMDTRLLFGLLGQSATLDVAIDRNRIVQYVAAQTRITAGDDVLQMLSTKYGRPTRIEWTEWKDLRTGLLVRRTPLHRWELRGLRVDFHAQQASTLGQLETPMGRIEVYTPSFAQLLARFAAQKAAAQPKGRF